MTTESKTRKNIDYSASAVDLRNDPLLSAKLYELSAAQDLADEHKAALEQTDAFKVAQIYAGKVTEITAEIKGMIDTLGSFQDTTAGMYAVKQRKVSLSYDAQKFKDAYPEFVPAVIVEEVNVNVLAGLIKGWLITELDLKDKGVTQETESFVKIVKV